MTDYRAKLRTDWPPERISAMLEELAAAETERSHEIQCKHCHRKGVYKLTVSDSKTRLAALQYAADHGYGRAAQAQVTDSKPVDTTVDPASLSSEERKALIQQLRARVTEQPNQNLPGD